MLRCTASFYLNVFLTNLVDNQPMTLKQGFAESFKLVFIADLADSADSVESKEVGSKQAHFKPYFYSHIHLQPHSKPYPEHYLNS